MSEQAALQERIAQLSAHRACTNEEHDPLHGKLSGYCVVCGIPWPCEVAKPSPLQQEADKDGELQRRIDVVRKHLSKEEIDEFYLENVIVLPEPFPDWAANENRILTLLCELAIAALPQKDSKI